MRETRSSSVSPSIETEAASIVRSAAPSKTGIACTIVMSSSASSLSGASQTMAFAGGRKDLLPGAGDGLLSETADLALGASSAGSVGLSSAAITGLVSAAGFSSLVAADFSGLELLRLEAGGGLVSRWFAGTLEVVGFATFERLLPNANQASKNAATPVSVGATSCELNSTVR